MRIVFMGTPEYSMPTVSALINAGHTVEAIFCQPDKPVGRKQVLTPPATKVFALENNIPVYQPSTLRDGQALSVLESINPDIIVVVAYGKILPENILDLPRFGAVNGHASLLPKLRGASPIQWAIVTGERQTGVTVMQMDKGMDTGDILSRFIVDIRPDETAGELFERLSAVTADAIVKVLKSIESGEVTPQKQDESLATYAPIITKEMAHIDFNNSAKKICAAVRGFNPWPVAFCFIAGKRIKIFNAAAFKQDCEKPGVVLRADNKLIIACGDNTAVELISVQPEGGKVMNAADMLRGFKIEVGTVVE